MNPYLALPLMACITSAALAVAILARGAHLRANRAGAALMTGAVLWSFCEVLWNGATRPGTVLWLVRISSLGWVAIGPLALRLFLDLTGAQAPRLRRIFPAIYGVPAIFFVLDLATPWMHRGVVRTSWGWGYTFGPLYPLFYAFTVTCLTVALAIGLRDLRRTQSPAERSQARSLMLGVGVPLVVASMTDGILPMLGYQPPRLGTASFTVLGGSVVWNVYRHGYSFLAPGDFASEILRSLRDGVALLRLDGRIRSANRGLARLVGIPERALENRAIGEWLRDVLLEPVPESIEQEGTLVSVSGQVIPISSSAALLRDKQHQPIGLVLVVRDLREVTSLRSRLVTSGRLAAVGQLAAGIAHEINNPIAYVSTNLGTLRTLVDELGAAEKEGGRDRCEAADEARELVDESIEGIQRVAAIVRDVKSFSHRGEGSREWVDLPAVLDAVLRVAAPQIRYAARVERHFADDLPPVLGNAQELKQVFLNLVINASQAVCGEEAIRISAGSLGDRVVVCVEDEGCGIPPDVIENIFDPFFTTKPVGEGTGLGLSIAYQIVRHHGGDLTVDSQPGRGTRFRVALPAAAQAAPSGGETKVDGSPGPSLPAGRSARRA